MKNLQNFRFFMTHPKIVILEWKNEPDDKTLHQLIEFQKTILKEFEEVIQITQGYCSLMLFHKNNVQNIEDYKTRLHHLYTSQSRKYPKKGELWQIPVCYEEDYAPDLKTLANDLNLNPDTLVAKHVSARYQVCFIGFLPGFLYLSGLSKVLECRRKEQPIPNVTQGSVAIGGRQTGIYPMDSPGGWHVIGKTPYPFFEPLNKKPCFAKAGDSVQFTSISRSEFLQLEGQRHNGTLKIKPL